MAEALAGDHGVHETRAAQRDADEPTRAASGSVSAVQPIFAAIETIVAHCAA
jgi:hypothetical protein